MRRLLFALLVVGVAAGCGGGGGQSVTPGGGTSGRSPQSIVTASPSPSPALYVSSKDRINVFNPTDTASTPPSRTIFVHANQVDLIAGISTYTDGTLDVVQNYYPMSDNLEHCRVVIESATANGDAAALTKNMSCPGNADPSTGYGIARNPVNGGFDVLFSDVVTGEEYVKHYTQPSDGSGIGTYSSYFALPSTAFRYLATDRGGHDYVDDTVGNVRKYTHAVTGETPATAQYFSVGSHSGAMAVSNVDLTLYVVLPGAGPAGVDELAGYTLAQYTGHPGAFITPSYVVDFDAGTTATALATDQNGYVYVGLTTSSGPRVKTFNAHLAGGTAIRNLDALPGDPATKITGISLYP